MRRAGICVLCLILVACASEAPRAPVEQRQGVKKAQGNPASHTVVRGDTLYGIAWRYGRDYRELARANGISRPYTIYPGQVLSLERARAGTPSAAARPVPKTTVTKPSPPRVTNTVPAPPDRPVSDWMWPTRGKIVRKYSANSHNGIDIDGKAGDAVQATAAGRVVYAGSGIVGYGLLVIVKHNETYLSAYGHNQSLLVSEGDTVKAGQRIAEKGNSGTNTVKLHFEIRREGKPVDPQRLLPSR